MLVTLFLMLVGMIQRPANFMVKEVFVKLENGTMNMNFEEVMKRILKNQVIINPVI